MTFNVKAKSKARFAIAAAEPAIALNADWQEWNDNDSHIKGFVRSDRRIELVKISSAGFHLTRANLPILAVKETSDSWHCAPAPRPENPQVSLHSDRRLRRATMGGHDLK